MGKLRTVLALALVSALIVIAVPISGVNAQETLLWEGELASPCPPPLSSPVLEAGREYRIVAMGAFASYDLSGAMNFAADAQYYTPYPSDWWIWDMGNTFPAPNDHSFLQINGMDVNWGPFSNGEIHWWGYTGHEYTIYYIGEGAPITFTIVDWIDDDCTNNFSHIYVKIYEGPPPPPPEDGHTPGYWRHQFNAHIDGKGKPQESWANLFMWTAMIDSESRSSPTPWGLPSLTEIDYDGDGTFTTDDAHNIFNTKKDSWNYMWTPLANWYNWAAGLPPV